MPRLPNGDRHWGVTSWLEAGCALISLLRSPRCLPPSLHAFIAIFVVPAGHDPRLPRFRYVKFHCVDEDLAASVLALSICIGIAVLPWLPRLSLFLLG